MLEDGFEIRESETSPQKSDSDDDGVVDAEEDPDSDGLINRREQTLGTDPHRTDSDSDQLTDSREQEIGTNATKADTDADGLEDGVEPEFGTDPLDPDTDDDGVSDGNETYTTDSNNESLGVSVRVTATGSIGKTVTIEENTEARFNNAYADTLTATPVVDLDTDESIENATVSLSYDESDLSVNESELVGVRYNESIQGFEPLPTTIDEANDTVHAQTDHFSTFTVFKVPNWQKMLTAQEPSNGGQDDPGTAKIDVMLVIDSSGSMNLNDPKGFRKVAAKEFVGALIDGDRAGVVDFDHGAEVTQELTTDFGSVNVTIESLDSSGGTDIGAGLQRANDHFAANSDDSRAQYTILLTDGQGSGGITQANTAADRETTIYTIGFGNANGDKLQRIADITSGGYSSVDDASDLPDVFSRVAEDIEPTHSDGDGFSDSLENNGIPISPFMVDDLDNSEVNLSANNIAVVYTNSEQNDTDGDTLHDDEEIGSEIDRTIEFYGTEYDIRYYTVKSDPTDPNSDDTGLNDSEEVAVGSDPMVPEVMVAGYAIPTLNLKSTPERPVTVKQLLRAGATKPPSEQWYAGGDTWNVADDNDIVLQPTSEEDKNWGLGGEVAIQTDMNIYLEGNQAGMDILEKSDGSPNTYVSITGDNGAEIIDYSTNAEQHGKNSCKVWLTAKPGESNRLQLTVGIPQGTGAGTGQKSLRDAINVRFISQVDGTPFGRQDVKGPYVKNVGYSTPASSVLTSTKEFIDVSAFTFSASMGAVTSGSGTRAAMSVGRDSMSFIMGEITDGKMEPTFPMDKTDLALVGMSSGIAHYKNVLKKQVEEAREDVNTTIGGAMTVRQR